uniref:Putative secreted protein n=1 Tax=Ixodes ricinus TaxID=34613 RepID=A0A6B0U372_IXORI
MLSFVNTGSWLVFRLVPNTVTFAFCILRRKGASPSGPSSNSWLPKHTALYIMFSIARATMLYLSTVYQTVP